MFNLRKKKIETTYVIQGLHMKLFSTFKNNADSFMVNIYLKIK